MYVSCFQRSNNKLLKDTAKEVTKEDPNNTNVYRARMESRPDVYQYLRQRLEEHFSEKKD